MSETIPLCAPQSFLSEDYIRLCDWMQARYGLPWRLGSCVSLVYARIYEATRHGIGIFCEPQAHLAELVGHSRRQVNQCLKTLEALKLIEVVGIVGHPKTGIRAYRVLADPVNRAIQARNEDMAARAAEQASAPVVDLGGVSPAAPAAELPTGPRRAPAPTAARNDETPPRPQPEAPASDSAGASGEDVRPVRAPRLSEEQRAAFQRLSRRYRKPCRGGYLEEAEAAYEELIEEGHTPEEIETALEAYLDDFFSADRPRAQKSQRYLKSLNRWLSEGSGARYWLSLISGPPRRRRDAAQESREWTYSRYNSGNERGWIASDGSRVLVLDVESEEPDMDELALALDRALAQERMVS